MRAGFLAGALPQSYFDNDEIMNCKQSFSNCMGRLPSAAVVQLLSQEYSLWRGGKRLTKEDHRAAAALVLFEGNDWI